MIGLQVAVLFNEGNLEIGTVQDYDRDSLRISGWGMISWGDIRSITFLAQPCHI